MRIDVQGRSSAVVSGKSETGWRSVFEVGREVSHIVVEYETIFKGNLETKRSGTSLQVMAKLLT